MTTIETDTYMELIDLLEELTSFPAETEWIEFKMGKGSITDVQIDRVQKQLEITDHAASELRKKRLIEGRKPNFFVGAQISQTTGQKAEYSRNKGLDKQYYLDFILQAISQHGSMNRKDIDNLLWNKLPEIINDKQKKNMITNLISELRINDKIVNAGTDKNSVWILKI